MRRHSDELPVLVLDLDPGGCPPFCGFEVSYLVTNGHGIAKKHRLDEPNPVVPERDYLLIYLGTELAGGS